MKNILQNLNGEWLRLFNENRSNYVPFYPQIVNSPEIGAIFSRWFITLERNDII